MPNTPLLSLAPLSYYWPRRDTLQFYADALEWPVDILYLGEVICERRHELKLEDWIAIANCAREAGKEVVLSSMHLIESEQDRRKLHRLIDAAGQHNLMVEANDYSAVGVLHAHRMPFVAGPHLNLYHSASLSRLRDLGAIRFTAPNELSQQDLTALLAQKPLDMQTEVHVWGRMALAFSARCFTARHHRLHKDQCEFRCLDYPDGLLLSTQENERFLNLNGIQTQSATCLNLAAQLPTLNAMHVEVLRLQVQSQNMATILACFDEARRNNQVAMIDPQYLPPDAQASDGYWQGKPGRQLISASSKRRVTTNL